MRHSFFGSYVALVTPMKGDGTIDYVVLERLIKWHISQETSGIVLASTTGESVLLSNEEREKIFETALPYKEEIDLVPATGHYNTEEAVRRTKRAHEMGFDSVISVTPYYVKPSQNGLHQHFSAIAESAPVSVMLYDVPGRTCVTITPETVIKLHQKYPEQISAIKYANPDLEQLSQITNSIGGDQFQILAGSDENAIALHESHNASGVVSVSANVVPGTIAKIWQAIRDKKPEEVDKLNESIEGLHPLMFIEPSPAPAKCMLARMGFIEEILRLPLVPVSATNAEELHQWMRKWGLV